MTRETEIKLEILRKLNEARALGFMLPETTLFQQVQLLVKPPPSAAELSEGLRALDDQRLVIGVQSALGGHLRWKITDGGKAELLNLIHS